MRRAPSARFLVAIVAAVLWPLAAEAQPVLSLSRTFVPVQANVGTNAPSTTVQVSNAGNRALKWSVVVQQPNWVSVSPTVGVNSGTLTLTFSTSALLPGTHQTSFQVQSATGSPILVTVQANIVGSPPPPPPTLNVTCPANMTVPSPDGSAVVVTYTATTSGGQAPVAVIGSPASGTSFAVGTTSVTVTADSSDGQTDSCTFSVTVTDSSSGDWTFCALENQFCAFSGTVQVRYGANGSYAFRTLTGGTPCTNSVFGDPIFGVVKECHVASTAPPPPPPPPPTGLGPQSSITCPAGAVSISPGMSIPAAVNANAAGTAFCLRSGVHFLGGYITPKTGNTFVGEFGAVLDGTGWTSTDGSDAAFRTFEQDVDFVTIRNLVIRNMPMGGIYSLYRFSDHWTIENNEIANNRWGITFGPDSIIRNNYIHHNIGNTSSPNPADRGGGFQGAQAHRTLIEGNEIAFNGREMKLGLSDDVTFRNNFVHHNVGDGIWYDGRCARALVDGNRIEDNGRNGVFYEISSVITVSNNAIRRNAGAGIFISTSENAVVHSNTLELNFGSILFFVNCDAVAANYDLINNSAYDNAITVGTQANTWSAGFSFTLCTSTQVAEYLNGSKNLTFLRNTYRVPSIGFTRYFVWNGLRDWTEWQNLGHDVEGDISQ